MAVVFLFRIFYLGSVVVGLVINWKEFKNAKWVLKELKRAQINGSRRMLAGCFVREECFRFSTQCFLLVPALVGMYYSAYVTPPQMLPRYIPLTVIAQLAHMLVALTLMLTSVIVKHDKDMLFDVLDSEAKQQNKVV